jgi:putative serine protease PepD
VRIVVRGESARVAEVREGDQVERPEDNVDASAAARPSRGVPEAWRNKGFRLCVLVTAFILAGGLSFGVGRALGLGDTVVLSAIPAPPKGDDIFVEDQEGIAADNLSNITESTSQGIVHVLSGGTSVGIGLVLTQTGKVLTPYQPSAGAANLAAEYVFSHETFKAKVIGVDPMAGLALLQMEGADGRPFSTVTVGNSDMIASSAAVARWGSHHMPGEIVDTAVSTTGTAGGVTLAVGTLTNLNATVAIDGVTWSGMLESTLSSPLPWVLGDPLVNPNGHVIGIVAGASTSGLSTIAYAIPINGALAVATQIADGKS